jgi:hypothetical protein
MKEPWPKCNGRKPGFADKVPWLEPGPHGGKGYCGKMAGHGFGDTHAGSERRAMRCKRHIGTGVSGPRGPDHYLFVTGEYSKFVQMLTVPELRAKLMEICRDPELLNMSPLVANLLRRLIALNDRAELGTLDIDRNLRHWEQADRLILANDLSGLSMTVKEGLEHAVEGSRSEAVWQEIYTLTDRVVRTQGAEMERRIAIGKWIRVDKIQGVREQVADYLKEAVTMYVDDVGTQAKILNHVAQHLQLEADRLERSA